MPPGCASVGCHGAYASWLPLEILFSYLLNYDDLTIRSPCLWWLSIGWITNNSAGQYDVLMFCHVLSICPAWLGLGLTFFYSITQGELHKACGKVGRRVSSIDHKILADSTSVGKPEGTSFILLVKRTLVHSNRTLQPETGLSENSVTTPHFMVDPSFAPLEWFRIAIWGYTPFSDSPKIILLATKMTIY